MEAEAEAEAIASDCTYTALRSYPQRKILKYCGSKLKTLKIKYHFVI